MLATGIRVVRGPDWVWENQDGGEGHVGTVREIGRQGSSNSPDKTVVVNWDSGNRTNYRVGYQDKFDLLIVDNAQIGVKHPTIICDGCSKAGIAGIRFRCSQCSNFDLCAMCYGNDIHDLDHPFIRFQSINSTGVRVPPREGAVKVQLKGIFVGAQVCRGPDWEWSNQDGGEDKTGRVMEIRGWDNESCRSVANVSWSSGSVNVYRLGHQGNVDLKYIQPAIGGYYYPSHMPVLGQTEEQQKHHMDQMQPQSSPQFAIGDRVKICIDLSSLVKLQKGHGGWNPRMEQFITKIGTVHRRTDKGDIRVQYENCANRWTVHPAALQKVYVFHVGDIVAISADQAKVQLLQRGHGEWVGIMRNALGKMGKVIKVYDDGDLRIQEIESGRTWTLNPKCVSLERSHVASAAERSNSMMDLSHQRADHVLLPLSGLSGTSAADKLVREASQGKLDYVKNYLSSHADQVDVMSGGKTCLQVAAHQGHLNLVRFLLSHGASVNKVDKEGDSTLHYAAFGNQPEIMRILLQNGADINVLNGSHCSALHISAHKKPPHCVKVLLEFGADINVQDSYGDTALHDAIGKENTEVVRMLCATPRLDLMVRNKRGFNALHHASLKGNVWASKRILRVARHLVDTKKEDGFAALHLAALNGHAAVVEVLVQEGQAEMDIRNKRRQTPFLLAVSQGHASVIEKLVNLGCDVSAKDEDGDNAIHLAIIKKSNMYHEVSAETAPRLFEIQQSAVFAQLPPCERTMYAIIAFVLEAGCPIEANSKNMLIFEAMVEKKMRDFILGFQAADAQTVPELVAGAQNDLANGEQTASTTTTTTSPTTTLTGSLSAAAGEGSSAMTLTNIPSGSENLLNNNNNILETSGGPNSNAEGEVGEDSAISQSGGVAPTTPMRRHRPQANNGAMNVMLGSSARDTATPSPSLNTDEHSGDASPPIPPQMSQSAPVPILPKKPLNSNNMGGSAVSSPPINRAIPPPVPPPMASSSSSSSGQQLQQDNHNNMNVNNNNNNSPSRSGGGGTQRNNVLNNNNNSPMVVNKISNSVLQVADPKECIVCNEVVNLLLFDPCGHQIACGECGRRMKKCLTCGTLIERRIDPSTGQEVTKDSGGGGGGGSSSSTSGMAMNIGSNIIQFVGGKPQAQPPQMQQQQQQPSSVDRLRYLESKIMEIEETHCCSICMERRRNVAFLCGHSACSKCAETLKTCHMCRKSIVKKINLY